jgi:ABC-2 type transport system permease protein
MLHLLKIEWLKIKNYRAFWVFAILYLISIFLVNYFTWFTQQRAFETMPGSEQIMKNIYVFPKVWQTVGWMSSWLLYFPGMLMIMLMVNEFNFKTHRQNVIDGLSRQQFINVKIVVCVLLAIVITIINAITGFIFGSISPAAFTWEGFENVGYIFLQAIAYIFFALMLAVLFRRSGLAIIVFILYGLIFEWLATALMTFQFKMAPVSYFLPLQISDIMIPVPFGDEVIYPDVPSIGMIIAGIAAYIFLYVFFTRKKFITDDL